MRAEAERLISPAEWARMRVVAVTVTQESKATGSRAWQLASWLLRVMAHHERESESFEVRLRVARERSA